ncbi:hypothetical protein EHM69_01875 [candidate division KSB1 bacterium]|nr:MAG: hypothetical protein EHM69_01875 [candidate division KSB1 bacterium]
MGFAATRAVGNSVCRHKNIRKLREFYRLNKELFPCNQHLFLLIRRPVSDWQELEGQLKNVLSTVA